MARRPLSVLIAFASFGFGTAMAGPSDVSFFDPAEVSDALDTAGWTIVDQGVSPDGDVRVTASRSPDGWSVFHRFAGCTDEGCFSWQLISPLEVPFVERSVVMSANDVNDYNAISNMLTLSRNEIGEVTTQLKQVSRTACDRHCRMSAIPIFLEETRRFASTRARGSADLVSADPAGTPPILQSPGIIMTGVMDDAFASLGVNGRGAPDLVTASLQAVSGPATALDHTRVAAMIRKNKDLAATDGTVLTPQPVAFPALLDAPQ